MFSKRMMNLLLLSSSLILVGFFLVIQFSPVIGQSSPISGTPRILETGEVRIGVRRDLGPYGFLDESGNCCLGFDIDIAKEFASRWGKTLKLVPLQASERIPFLINGDVDMVIGAMTHTKERDLDIDFSQSYFRDDGLRLLVHKDSAIQDLSDLENLQVGGISGTTGFDWAASQAAKYNFVLAIPFNSYDDAVEVLINGGVSALISDAGALLFRAEQQPDLLKVVGGPYTDEFYGIGVPQGDLVLRELVNYTLQAMKEDGTYDKIYQKDEYRKWFGDKEPFSIDIAPGEKIQKIEDYRLGINVTEESRFEAIIQAQKTVIGVPATKSLQADIAREFAQRWLGDVTTLDLRIVTTQTGTTALINGEIDLLINNLLPTWQADQAIDFSQTYAAAQAHLLVYNNSGIQKLEDLRNKAIAFVVNTPYQQWVEIEALRYSLQAKSFVNYEAAFSALELGEVTAVVGDQEELNFGAKENIELLVLETAYTIPYVIGVPQGDFRLRELVNFTLQTMKEDGFYDCLSKKWFPNGIPYAIEQLPGEESYLPLRYQNEEGRTCLPKSTIQRIRERGNVVVVGVLDNFAPMGFIDEKGEWVGFDLDLVNAMANLWGVDVEFVKVLANQRIDVLVSGEVDFVAAAMTHTRDRDTLIDFSQNYFLDGQSLLVRKGSDISSQSDLNGKRVGAIDDTTGMIGITTFRDNKGLQCEIVSFSEDPVAVDALEKGSIDAFTTDRVALLQFAAKYTTLTVVGEPFSREPYGLALPAGDSQFRHLVDATLQELKSNKRYDEIFDKWFPGSVPYSVEILPSGKQPYPLTIAALSGQQSIPTRSVIEKMQSDNKLEAGVIDEFAPFGSRDANGDCCIGFDVDIIKELAKRWLGDDSETSLEFVPLKTDQRIPALVGSEIDREVDIVAAAMTHNWERDADIDFSQTYFSDVQSLLVKKRLWN